MPKILLPEAFKEPYRWLRAGWERLVLPSSLYSCDEDLDLIMFDSGYPNIHAGFRMAELNIYLDHFPNSKVISDNQRFQTQLPTYLKRFPQNKGRILKFNRFNRYDAKLAYIIFANETRYFLPYLERNQIPFVFTLYPGGGFCLDHPASDQQLKKIFGSSLFRTVFVTQSPTYHYLLKKNLCPQEKMVYIYPGIGPFHVYTNLPQKHLTYKKDKPTFDLCFVAFKYSKYGVEKGYDVFIAVAHQLAKRYHNIHFHVVGNFSPEVLDVSALGNRIRFYGPQPTDFFPTFYRSMDIFIAASRFNPNLSGQFDAIPNFSTLEAAMGGVVLFVPNFLNMNTDPITKKDIFTNRKHLRFINYDINQIAQQVEYYYHHPKELEKMSANMKKKLSGLFNDDYQLKPRFELLEREMKRLM